MSRPFWHERSGLSVEMAYRRPMEGSELSLRFMSRAAAAFLTWRAPSPRIRHTVPQRIALEPQSSLFFRLAVQGWGCMGSWDCMGSFRRALAEYATGPL